jgi:hypothetical protein
VLRGSIQPDLEETDDARQGLPDHRRHQRYRESTAYELARMGATIVIVGRDAQKTNQVVEEIRATSGNDSVDSLLADLS